MATTTDKAIGRNSFVELSTSRLKQKQQQHTACSSRPPRFFQFSVTVLRRGVEKSLGGDHDQHQDPRIEHAAGGQARKSVARGQQRRRIQELGRNCTEQAGQGLHAEDGQRCEGHSHAGEQQMVAVAVFTFRTTKP